MTQIKSPFVCGEAPAVLIQRLICKVLCVTLYHSAEQEARLKAAGIVRTTHFHEPLTGELIMEVIGVDMNGTLVPAEVRVTFDGKPCKFLEFDTGLSGCVHTVHIEALERRAFADRWRFYTDVPTKKGIELGVDVPKHPSGLSSHDGNIWGAPDPLYANDPDVAGLRLELRSLEGS